MKLGTETGSLVNHILSRSITGAEPTIGMGVTFFHWTDRTAGTIVYVESFEKIINGASPKYIDLVIGVKEDHAKRTDTNGISDDQSYTYAPNPSAPTIYFWRVNGKKWERCDPAKRVGWKCTSDKQRIGVGYRDKHHDFSF